MIIKRTLILIIISLPFLFYGCHNTEGNSKFTVPELPDITQIKSRNNNTSSTLLSVSSMVIYNDMLITLNSKNDHLFHVFQLPDCNFLGSINGYGKGPEEFVRVNSRCFGIKDSSLYLYDMAQKRLSFFKVVVDSIVSIKKIKSIDIPGNFDNINGLFYSDRNNALIGHVYGIYENNNNVLQEEYFEYSSSNHVVNQFSAYPSFLGKEVNVDAAYLVYLKRIIPKPDGSKFAALYSNFGAVRIYDLPGLSLIKETLVDLPRRETIEVENGGGVNLKNHYVYYNYTYATDNYFYGLYFGEKIKVLEAMAKKDGGKNIKPQIHIWDWQGNCVARIQPDNPISTFAVSKNDEMIYGVSPFNTDIIHTFDLDQVLK